MKNQPNQGMKGYTGFGLNRVVLLLVCIFSLCYTNGLNAQKEMNIDSLMTVLGTVSEDTNKVINLNTLAKQLTNNGDYDSARKNAHSALVLAENLNYKIGIARSYVILATIEENNANYPVALENYQLSLKLFEEIGDKRGVARIYNIIGLIYQD